MIFKNTEKQEDQEKILPTAMGIVFSGRKERRRSSEKKNKKDIYNNTKSSN